MKLKPYIEAIQQSEEEEQKTLAPARAEEAKAQLGMEQAKLSIKIQKAKNVIAQVAGRHPLDVQSILDAQDELDLLERQAIQLSKLGEELFPKGK